MMLGTLLIIAAVLPIVSAGIAKFGKPATGSYDNHEPRAWLAKQTGYRARANAAQQNAFEALPFFYAAVLYALHQQADLNTLTTYVAIWLVLRVVYLVCYVADWSSLRTLVFVAAFILNGMIVFSV